MKNITLLIAFALLSLSNAWADSHLKSEQIQLEGNYYLAAISVAHNSSTPNITKTLQPLAVFALLSAICSLAFIINVAFYSFKVLFFPRPSIKHLNTHIGLSCFFNILFTIFVFFYWNNILSVIFISILLFINLYFYNYFKNIIARDFTSFEKAKIYFIKIKKFLAYFLISTLATLVPVFIFFIIKI